MSVNGFHSHEFSLVFIISQFHWSSGSVQALSFLLHVAEEVRQQCQVICIFQVLQALSGGPLYAIECSVVYIKR